MAGIFGVSKEINGHNTTITGSFKNKVDWNLCVGIMSKRTV
jgi:hypothetical protein